MNYDEACEATISAAEAHREIEKHEGSGISWESFVRDHGDHAKYEGSLVLAWLGY
jgi:hypothetical protein